jgi:hypothetical protein
MKSFKTTWLLLSFIALQCFANRAPALPTAIETGQYTDRFLPTLENTVIPPGDNIQIYAYLETTDPPGSPTIGVTAKQGDTMLTLERFAGAGESYFYWGFIDFDPSLTGAWEIIPTDSTGIGPSAFANSLAEPELLPYVESITPQGSPRGASAEWTLPDLTGFDVDDVHVRIVQVEPRGTVYSGDLLPAQTTSFEPPPGILQYGLEYVYLISLIDSEGFYGENRSGVQSEPFRFVLPGDFNADGAVDAADLAQWQGDFGTNGDSDADNDNDTDGADFLAWQRALGSAVPTISANAHVPEPSTAMLVLVSAVGIRRVGRRLRQKLVSA